MEEKIKNGTRKLKMGREFECANLASRGYESVKKGKDRYIYIYRKRERERERK